MSRDMKDSGNEWIGLIPQDWYTIPFKHFFRTGKGLSFTKADLVPEGNAVISYGQIHSKLNTGTRLDANLLRYVPDSITENGDTSKVFKGDFIFADTSEDIEGCGNCAYIDKQLDVYAGYHSVIAHWKVQNDNKYYAYFFMSPYWRSQVRCRVSGIKVFSISQSIINSTTLVVPPRDEQDRIAHHLDKVCSDIDEMIVLQEKVIEELKAYKQSIITEAVTKGLNPNVPMKNSGIDWIGEIPEHWKIEPLKYCFGRRSEKNSPIKTEERLSLSIDKGVTPYADKTTNLDRFKDDFTQYQLAYPNDIVLNCMNMIVGAVGLSNYMGCVSPVYYVIYPSKQNINPHYYSYLLNIPTIRGVYYSLGKGIYAIERGEGRVNTCRLKVSYNDFGRLEIPVPPVQEQKDITLYIQKKCSEIDSLIAIKQQKIEELKEYKKSVIYEYVTGKKEVPYGE